jgi:hypothetical protein
MRTATKLTLAAGLGAGYVLGTRAGRERYEKMKTGARKVADAPAVKQTANVIQVQAYELGRNAASKGKDVVVHFVEVVRERGDHEPSESESGTAAR